MRANPGYEGIALGDNDVAVLARLRAIARLFRAAGKALPVLDTIEIGLWVGPTGVPYPFGSMSWPACDLIARVAGWEDLVAARDKDYSEACDAIYQRAAAIELPTCPPALLRLLTDLHTGTPPEAKATAARLARWGWTLHPDKWFICPLLSAHTSAHETLELLADTELAGGLGSGPLAILAALGLAELSKLEGWP